MLSSTIIEDQLQGEGWRSITERHVFDDGHVQLVRSVAAAGLDAAAQMQARVPQLEADDTAARQRIIARALFKSATAKTQAFLLGMTNLQLSQQVGMTAGEIAAFRAANS